MDGFPGSLTLEARIAQVLEELRAMRAELRAVREAQGALDQASGAASSPLLSVEQVAARCHAEPKTVRAWIGSGKLRALKAGHRYLVRLTDLERYFTADSQGAQTPTVTDQLANIMKTLHTQLAK